jgi:hypothetical protein
MFRIALVLALAACSGAPASRISITAIDAPTSGPVVANVDLAGPAQLEVTCGIEGYRSTQQTGTIGATGTLRIVVPLAAASDTPTVRCTGPGGRDVAWRRLARPPRFVVGPLGAISCVGLPCRMLLIREPEPALHVEDAPDGAVITFGTASGTARRVSGGIESFTLKSSTALAPGALAQLRLADYFAQATEPDAALSFGPLTTLSLKAPAGTLTMDVPVTRAELRTAIEALMLPIKHGAVRFPDDHADDGGAPSVLVVRAFQPQQLYGAAEQLRDVDRVALIEEVSRSVDCGRYGEVDFATGRTTGQKLMLSVVSLRATVFDRRSGKQLGTKTFAPPRAECPAATTRYGDGSLGHTVMEEPARALAYAATFAK